MKTHSPDQKGFTIIELMISTAVFSVVLLIVTAGVITFTHQYLKGVTYSETQTTTRTIMNRLAQDIQFSTAFTPIQDAPDGSYSYFCIGNDEYVYQVGQEVESNPTGPHQGTSGFVMLSNVGACSDPGMPDPAGARELLGDSMRLANLEVQDQGDHSFTIDLKVIYGDDDLLTPNVTHITSDQWANEQCQSQTGQEFCATVTLSTAVTQRL